MAGYLGDTKLIPNPGMPVFSLLPMKHLGIDCNKHLINWHYFSFKTMHLQMSSTKWQPSCWGRNVLKDQTNIYCWLSSQGQWGKLTLANVSTFWAGQRENWPGRVEFCIEHIPVRDICFRASAPEILFPTLMVSITMSSWSPTSLSISILVKSFSKLINFHTTSNLKSIFSIILKVWISVDCNFLWFKNSNNNIQ